jgi:hypothetical protein
LAATDPGPTPSADVHTPSSGGEPITADLVPGRPRVTTRTLLVAVLVLVVLLVASLVVAVVVLHQPRLTPVPVPSVSSIA